MPKIIIASTYSNKIILIGVSNYCIGHFYISPSAQNTRSFNIVYLTTVHGQFIIAIGRKRIYKNTIYGISYNRSINDIISARFAKVYAIVMKCNELIIFFESVCFKFDWIAKVAAYIRFYT